MELKHNKNNISTVSKIIYFFRGKKKLITRSFLLMLGSFLIIGGYFASHKLQTKGYSGLWDFIKTVSSNYLDSRNANPETISIEIKEKDFKKLEMNRQQALERGVIINDIDGDYVGATIEYQGKKIKVKLRLKGHMVDHLQNDKWSFRIKVKDKDSFMGMKRFSIQHPGTRGYIYEWIYHQLMKKEDVIALRYKFINVFVNGKDWGIYAVEENFDKELIQNNNRKVGPIIRFNPDLYWVDRYNEIKQSQPVAEFASYYSSAVEAYREDDVLEDSLQKQYYLKATALMDGFRNRTLTIDQVFDVQRLAKFNAIIDLVGGQHSIDWSDIKYYYNPVSAKLEPVSYESFTQFPFQELSGTYKYSPIDSSGHYLTYHEALFSNPAFFKEYIRQLERISEPNYLDKFFGDNNEELKKNLSILYKEFPYKKFDKTSYYENQLMIKQLLSAPKAFQAYMDRFSNSQVYLQVAGIESLPVEISSVSISGSTAFPSAPIILSAKKKNQNVIYKEYVFSFPSKVLLTDSVLKNLKVNYTILGGSTKHDSKVLPFPHADNEFIANDLKNKQSTILDFSFLEVNEITKSISIRQGKYIVQKDLVIPSGYQFIVKSGVCLDIKSSAKIISYSPFIFEGDEDEPIIIESSDSTSEGIEFINTGNSIFKYVNFRNLPKVHDNQWARTGAITFYESPVEFENCNFYNCKAEDAINLIRSKFSFKECLFHKVHDDALDIDFSEGVINNCVFENCKENALDITMGRVKINAIYINGAGNKALNVKSGTFLKGSDVKVVNANIGISAEDQSYVNLANVSISDSKIGVIAYKNKPDSGHAKVEIVGLVLKNVKTNYLIEKKSTMIINGKDIGNKIDDVETIIKGDKGKNK